MWRYVRGRLIKRGGIPEVPHYPCHSPCYSRVRTMNNDVIVRGKHFTDKSFDEDVRYPVFHARNIVRFDGQGRWDTIILQIDF